MAAQADELAKMEPELTVAQLREFRFVTVFERWGIGVTRDKELVDRVCPKQPREVYLVDSVTKVFEYEVRFGRGTLENARVVMRERGQLAGLRIFAQAGYGVDSGLDEEAA
jgi:hypothetical protein